MTIQIQRVTGDELLNSLDDVARLRIEVFREYPYLYEGSEEAEREYLKTYVASDRAVVVLARVDGRVIGASTGLPLVAADPAFQRPLQLSGEILEEWFYFGESVLCREFRGRGAGHCFFDEREAHAAELGFKKAAFCSVVRPLDHPLKPDGYRGHDTFWSKRGYRRTPEWRCRLGWQQVGSNGNEVENELAYWTRELSSKNPNQM